MLPSVLTPDRRMKHVPPPPPNSGFTRFGFQNIKSLLFYAYADVIPTASLVVLAAQSQKSTNERRFPRGGSFSDENASLAQNKTAVTVKREMCSEAPSKSSSHDNLDPTDRPRLIYRRDPYSLLSKIQPADDDECYWIFVSKLQG